MRVRRKDHAAAIRSHFPVRFDAAANRESLLTIAADGSHPGDSLGNRLNNPTGGTPQPQKQGRAPLLAKANGLRRRQASFRDVPCFPGRNNPSTWRHACNCKTTGKACPGRYFTLVMNDWSNWSASLRPGWQWVCQGGGSGEFLWRESVFETDSNCFRQPC